jgi:hypothetical protein
VKGFERVLQESGEIWEMLVSQVIGLVGEAGWRAVFHCVLQGMLAAVEGEQNWPLYRFYEKVS